MPDMKFKKRIRPIAEVRATDARIIKLFLRLLEGESMAELAEGAEVTDDRIRQRIQQTLTNVMRIVKTHTGNEQDYHIFWSNPKTVVQYRSDKEIWLRCIAQYKAYWLRSDAEEERSKVKTYP